ncbi:hypothetical protein Taro_038340 [Colocasia esculenta]|uniref:Pentatricopeptide repeat-containing protein n=1 Tax=Colocasia esculenta TaxID=4460 RepID=A0A843WFL4_COLES|nr:hypothetical protein [Colocasia esculenta]
MLSEFVAALAARLQKCAAAAEGTFSSVAVKGALRRTQQLHAVVVVSAPCPHSPFLNNNLIATYGRCGFPGEARRLFDVMPQRSVVSYNVLISVCCRDPVHAPSALRLLPAMASMEIRPTASTLSSLLQATSCLGGEKVGSMLHARVVVCGFLANVCVQTALLVMYSTLGRTDRARRMFGEMAARDTVAWNSMILAHVKNSEIHRGLLLFYGMLSEGLQPTNFTFSIVAKACSRSGDRCTGEATHALIVKAGSPDDVPLHNALLDMYASWGNLEAADSIFRWNRRRDLVSWNSMLAGYAEHGNVEKAVDLFVQLWASPEPLEPDEYTLAAIISATAALPAMKYGKPLHAQVVKCGLESSVFVGSTLLDMYFKNQEPCFARRHFSMITEKDVVLWTDMIAGHARAGEGETAMMYLNKMLEEGHALDGFSLSSSLISSADLAALKQGEIIHSVVVKTGYETEICVCGSLVDMYAKNGVLEAAASVFHRTVNPDLKCWNSMLGGHGHHGNAEQAFKLFEDMLEHGIEPDQVTFLSLLSACSHCGLVERGKLYWYKMFVAGFLPGPKHYTCMVSLLSKAGLLQEAEEFISSSPFVESFPELWRILLSSCVVFRDLHRGVHAANQVLTLDPDDGTTHVLLSNLYASVGRWDAVAEMRRKFRGLMLVKDPGLSWIEIGAMIHAFSAGDESHTLVDDARAVLQRLLGNLKGWEMSEADLT